MTYAVDFTYSLGEARSETIESIECSVVTDEESVISDQRPIMNDE